MRALHSGEGALREANSMPRGSDMWRSIRAEVAGGFLVLVSIVGALALVFRARRRRA